MSTSYIIVFCIMFALWPFLPRPGVAAEALRVCADPDNLPFTSDNPAEPGLYVELAKMIAVRLGMSTEYTWWRSYFGKRTVRNTLLSDQCDAYFALPYDKGFMGKSVALPNHSSRLAMRLSFQNPLHLSALMTSAARRWGYNLLPHHRYYWLRAMICRW